MKKIKSKTKTVKKEKIKKVQKSKLKEKVKKVVSSIKNKIKVVLNIDNLKSMNLDSYTARNIFIYGTYTIQNRALADYRDGLKPVQRRVIYAMYKMGLHFDNKVVKSARVVGEAMGKFHPHGSSGIYTALVNMTNPYSDKGEVRKTNIAQELIAGQGNFGTFDDPPAAERYTECKLSKYSDLFLLDPEYMEVVDYVPNYDGTNKEPILLPSLLPTILLNGAEGIAVGTTTKIPPFKVKGILKLVEKALNGSKIDAKDCLNLEFNYPNGSLINSDKKDLLEYYKTGDKSLNFKCDYKVDHAKRELLITGITPSFNFDSFTKNIMAHDKVQSVLDVSDGESIKIRITFKKGSDIKACIKSLEKYFKQNVSFKTNITIQKIVEDNGSPESSADFKSTTIPNIINDWVAWRIELELKMLKNLKRKLELKLKYFKLLKFAISKLDIIFKVLKSKTQDLNKELSKKLKISVDDAKTILDLQTRRLSKLSDKDVSDKIASIKTEIKIIEKHIKKPEKKILDDLSKVCSLLK